MSTFTIDLSGLPIGALVTVPTHVEVITEELPELPQSVATLIESELKDFPYSLKRKLRETREAIRREELIASGKIPTINIIL